MSAGNVGETEYAALIQHNAVQLSALSAGDMQHSKDAESHLADRVVRLVVDRALDGTYPPGTLLPREQDLAVEAGVSRLTVREGIRVLRTKNVVQIHRGRGTLVNPVDNWAPLDAQLLIAQCQYPARARALARQLMELRQIVEVGLAGLAAERSDRSSVLAIEDALQQMRDTDVVDLAAFNAADLAFHDAVMAAADNELIVAILHPIRGLLQEMRRRTGAHAELHARALSEHAAILDAIASGDPARARTIMGAHLSFTSSVLREAND